MTTSGRKHKPAPSAGGEASGGDDPPGEGGPDEAVAFIAETVPGLRKLAERHNLGVLHHLLGMVQLEAEERLRLRSRRKLS